MTDGSIALQSLGFIKSIHSVRPLDERYLSQLMEKIKAIGPKPAYPLSVTPDGILYGGCHRFEAFKRLGFESAWMHVKRPESLDREAIELNRASEDAKPMTFVDYAELIWRKLADSTQQKVADELGWQLSKLKMYSGLKSVCGDAWEIVKVAINGEVATQSDEDDATNKVANATFTEGLLRNILDLLPDQQIELCGLLAKGKDKKGHKYGKADFKSDAAWYRAFNVLWDLADKRLSSNIPEPACSEYARKVQDELKAHSEYTDEWLKNKAPGDKFAKLIQAQIDDWQQKNNVKIIVKDLRLLTADDIESESVDCVITDPPYPKDFIELFDDLGALASRVLKPGGSLIAMTGQLYLPRYIELLSKHLTYHWTLAYLTPGGQAVQVWNQEVNTFWKPLLWFTKDARDARWVSDVVNTPTNDNDKTHHKWGQGVAGMRAIIEKFTNPGDCVLDPFLGGGTTGLVCKRLKRKFIGVEIDEETAKKAIDRIHGGE